MPPSRQAKKVVPAPKTAAKRERLTQAERTALSDQRMFDAAITLIAERGTQKTTLKDIGSVAGYSRGLATYRFGSKDKLFRELIHHFNGIWEKELVDFVAKKRGLPAFLAAIDAIEHFLKAQSAYMRGMYILWYESIGAQNEVREKLAEQHEAYRRDAERWINEGIKAGDVNPDIAAKQFAVQYCAFVFGMVYQWLVNPDALDLEEVFATYRKTALLVLKHK